ncbi:AMP-binding protein [Pseudonocardia nematodicida]|uniref:AMP-binding protein n=1 Tax=Pseudonocardia nematodicida TaxID=1206997 RepID=A0ABV1KJJ2_9PSEU
MTVTGRPARGDDTLATVLRGHAARTPDAPFLAFERGPGAIETTTYAEQLARAGRTAGALHRLGVRPGDRFGIHLTNCPEFYDAWFAAALLGAAAAPSNPLATADELAYQVEHAGCAVVVTQPDLRETVERAGAATVVDTAEPWVRDDDVAPAAQVDPTSPVSVLYTSGTTSRPKGVLLSHAAYLHCGDVVAGHLRLRPDDRQLVVLPLFHGNAQFYSTMSALVTGASVGLAPKFTARRWSAQATALGGTVASLFAAPIRMILAASESDQDTAHRLRAAMFAQNVTDDQLAEFERRFDVPLIQLYGMTETVVPPLMNPLYEQRRGASIGRPVPGARVRIADPDSRGAGELQVHGVPGHTIMTGYLDDPAATAGTLEPDGAGGAWLHTGDTVRADDDGYLHFVDRRKDMIKRAGENVASGEVERVVSEHEAVFECAAVGVPDEMRDEAIHVYVVRHDGRAVTEEDLLAHCRERMAKFKVPDHVEFVAELPRTSVGKIQKHLLRHR